METFFEIASFIGINLLRTLCLVVPLILCVAYLVWAERKILAAMQLRHGPSVVGIFGLLQPIADAVKLLFKETIFPANANRMLFALAPVITFSIAMAGWAVVPFTERLCITNINVGVLYMLAISSLGVYGVIIAGWASNSKYAFLGAIRSAAQMISYEVSIGLVIVCSVITSGSLNLTDIVKSQADMPLTLQFLMLPMSILFFISILAETNRHPFDLPEAEAELVAGYNVEYSSMAFALFFLGEYANMYLMSAIMTILFFGGWLPPFGIGALNILPPLFWFCFKIVCCLFAFIWVRAAFPRYRYDQLMRLGWKVFLPLSLVWVILISSVTLFIL